MAKDSADMSKVRVEIPDDTPSARTDVVALAVQRIERRKKANTDVKKPALQEDIENFIQDPKSYTEWTVKYLWENRNALVKAIQQELFDKGPNIISAADLISYIMDRHVHPHIADKIIFTVGEHWEKAELGMSNSALGIFLHNTLSALLTDLAKDCIVWKKTTKNYDTYQTPYFLTGDKKDHVQEIPAEQVEYKQTYRNNSSDYTIKNIKKINVSQFLAIIKKRGFDFIDDKVSLAQVLKKLHEVIDAYVCETDLKNDYKDEFTWLDSKTQFEKVFATAGSYIYKGIRENTYRDQSNIDLNDSIAIHRFIEKLICDISGIKEKTEKQNSETSAPCGSLPKLERLTNVREQLLIHMQRLSIGDILQTPGAEQEFFVAYDRHAFEDSYSGSGQAQRFAKEYEQANDWFGKNTKRAKKSALDKKIVADEIPNIYRMMEYIYKLHKTGEIYVASNDIEQQRQGEVLKEVAQISADYLGRIIVDLEAKLAVGDFSTEQLSDHVAQLAGLLDSQQLQTAIKSVRLIESEIEIRRDSQVEVEMLLEPLAARKAEK